MREPNNRVYKTVVVLWLTLSIASVALATINWLQLSSSLALAREAATFQALVDQILKSLVDAETGQRGFTITSKAEFLEPFLEAEIRLPVQFDQLMALSRTDPVMLKRGIELRIVAEKSLDHQRKVIETVKEEGRLPAADLVASGAGRVLMDDIRRRIGELRRMRSSLVSDDGDAAQSQLMRASLTSLVAAALGIGAGLFALYLSRLTLQHQERERKLVEAKLRAERNSQEKTVFLANMSHEIRTPMNAILGFTELLQGETSTPKHARYLQSIRDAAGSLLQIINDILDMAKVEAGVMELHPEPTDPREICDFVHSIFSGPASRKGVKLECKVAEDLPRAVLIDRIRLRQILINLVGNAVKFTDRGNIYVRILCEKQLTSSHITLMIEVQDTGVGIPQDKLETIFNPFVQAGTHSEKEKQGTGLGLSIVRRLTELMGGTVTAASVVNQGAAFHLRFPDVPVSVRLPASSQLASNSESDFNRLRPATILVVDDNDTNCRLIAGMFDGTHHRLFFGSEGHQAVAKARAIRPDIILLDIRMPGMDGREALAELRKIPEVALTPVIAVTASNLIDKENEMNRAFDGYLRKPFSKPQLFEELAHFLPHSTQDPRVMAADGATPANLVTSKAKGSLPEELVIRLRQLAIEQWPGVRDSVAFNESKAFAQTLEKLGQEWNCEFLVSYAQALLCDTENYDATNLEKHLREFPAMFERIS